MDNFVDIYGPNSKKGVPPTELLLNVEILSDMASPIIILNLHPNKRVSVTLNTRGASIIR